METLEGGGVEAREQERRRKVGGSRRRQTKKRVGLQRHNKRKEERVRIRSGGVTADISNEKLKIPLRTFWFV